MENRGRWTQQQIDEAWETARDQTNKGRMIGTERRTEKRSKSQRKLKEKQKRNSVTQKHRNKLGNVVFYM